MITLRRNINFNFPGASYVDWTISTNNSCVQLDKTTGRSFESTFDVPLTLTYRDAACFSAVITAFGIDSNGCTRTQTFSISNICTGLTVQVASGGDLKAVANITGGATPHKITWVYDTGLFNAQGESSTTLTLIPKADLFSTTTQVLARVEDVNGCTTSSTYNMPIPRPVLKTVYNVNGVCTGNTNTWTIDFSDVVNIDIASFKVLDNDQITFTAINSTTIQFNIPLQTTDFSFTVQVKNKLGVSSNFSTINVKVLPCPSQDKPVIIGAESKIASQSAVTNYELDLSQGADISSLAFVPTTGQSLSGSTLNMATGSAVVVPPHTIRYTNTLAGIDRIRFRVANADGVYGPTFNLYTDTFPFSTPTASNFSLNAGVGVTITDNLANRFSTQIKNYTIVTPPTLGQVTIVGGILYYTASSTGSDSIVLTGTSYDNVTSSNVTISLTNSSSGVGVPGFVCNGGNANLTTQIQGYTAGGVWSQSGANPSTVVLTNPAVVPFSGKPSGTYTFTYTLGLTSTVFTMEHRQYSGSGITGVFLNPTGTPTNVFRVGVTTVSADVNSSNLRMKVYRIASPTSPTIPTDFFETVSFTTVTPGGQAILDYTTTCNFNYVGRIVVLGNCGEVTVGDTAFFGCAFP